MWMESVWKDYSLYFIYQICKMHKWHLKQSPCEADSYSASKEFTPLPFVVEEPEGSFLCSQESSTGLYPEPDESDLHSHILFKFCFDITHLSVHRFFIWSLPSRFSNLPLSSLACVLHAQRISSWSLV